MGKNWNFDWYSASVYFHPGVVLKDVSAFLKVDNVIKKKGRFGARVFSLVRDGVQVASISHGGSGQGSWVSVSVSGSTSRHFVPWFRTQYPDHKVTRADVCIDLSSPNAWHLVSEIAGKIHRQFGIRYHSEKSGLDGEDGRTIYLGSKTSPVQVCIYEKGKEQRVKARQKGLELDVDENRVRVEVRVKPKSIEAQTEASQFVEERFLGGGAWLRSLCEKLGNSDIPTFKVGTVWKPSSIDQQAYYMVYQYRAVLESLIDKASHDPAQFGGLMLDLMAQDATARSAAPSPSGSQAWVEVAT